MNDDQRSQWLESIRSMTATTEAAARFLDRRLQFTTSIAALLSPSDPDCDRLVYGVWIDGHRDPIYVGQTSEGRRRLWDLPIGESHHLANSFPPEIWSRVVVVYWERILKLHFPMLVDEVTGALENSEMQVDDIRSAIGLGLEYLLQRNLQPLFNRRKKLRTGSWRNVDWESSASLGARTAPALLSLFQAVMTTWQSMSSIQPIDEGKVDCDTGCVVFPSLMLTRFSERNATERFAR